MMKKRIASLLVSAGLLLSMAVPAFAAQAPLAPEAADAASAAQETAETPETAKASQTAETAQEASAKDFMYVALGDSVTAGVGLSGLQFKQIPNGFDMSGNYKGHHCQFFVGY